jgi:trans-aconitate methyltransferase
MRFDHCAHTYDAYAAPQRAFAARVAEFIHAGAETDVIELGAGTGALTRSVCAATRVAVHATDASPAMVELGRKNVPEARWSRLDAFIEPVPQSQLQLSSGLLQWAGDPERVLRKWKAALRPGGRMAHAFPCEPCLREWRSLVPEGPVRWRDEAAWSLLFEAAGLKISRKRLWLDTMLFSSALDMIRAMHRSGVTGHPRLGPGRLRQAMRTYEADHRSPGGISATWAWLAIEAH